MSELAKRKRWFERNEQAERLEAQGKTLEALRLYEENENEGCDVAYTYERMATLYRSLKEYEKEVHALEQAVTIEEQRGPSAQVIRLKQRLEASREVREREGPRGSVLARDGGRVGTRRKKVKKKTKKGCLSMIVVLLTTAGLAASVLA